tara:strand:+ start:1521 stop:1733 length:213 start_codon:yes stop_codon:yes gene_type:complete
MKVSERGQVTIPKKIRDKFGLDFNAEIEIIEANGEVKLRKKSKEHPVDKVAGILNSPMDTDKFLDKIRGK